MAYQSLYRRYRPQTFAEVRGQDHLVQALRNAVVEGRVGHAYLFSGPRGTGKTSTARILAKVLNCEHVVDGEPCGTCTSCLAIEHGTSFDVFELDAASNNGVEAIRDLINRTALGSPGRTKVYILDEVHMLSTAASNALLKTLEEPPDHVVFVLATTDPQKVLPTIKSRTQHFEVHLLPAADLESLVADIVADAGLDVSQEGIDYVLRVGGGSARDTLSALDQVVAAGGVPDDGDALDELVEALCDRDTGRALIAVDAAINSGRTPRVLGENLIARLRDVFLSAMKADLSRLPERELVKARSQAERLGAAGSTRALEVLGDAFVGIADSPDPRIPLEVALVRLTKPEADHSLEVIVERLERLERGLGPLGTPPPPAPHTGVHPHVDAAESAEASSSSSSSSAGTATPAPSAAPPDDLSEGVADPDPAGPPAGGRPADLARQQLASKRGAPGSAPARGVPKKAAAPAASSRPGPPGPPGRPRPPAAARPAAPATPAAPTTPADPSAGEGAPEVASPSVPAGAPVAAPAAEPAPVGPARAAGGALPSRDELTLAWGDTVLSSLSLRAKSRFAAGRFVTVADGVAQFGLPNDHHAKRCLEVKAEVEAALEQHFGVSVPLEIIVDGDAVAPRAPGVPPPPEPDDGIDESTSVDVTDLVDADAGATSTVERIASVFPGVEVVDEP